MATERIPCGGWDIDTSTLQFQNKVLKAVGGITGAYLPLSGGIMEADATIQGTDNIEVSVSDSNQSAVVGVTQSGVTIEHNTNSDLDSSIRTIENTIELAANGTTVTINGTGINFGGATLTNIGSIGNSAATEIAFESDMDMNNHKITGLPTQFVANATDTSDIITNFNNLLAQLQAAGILPASAT